MYTMNYRMAPGVIALLFLLFISCNGSSPKAETSLLWKISGNGLEKPSYLFGTHHLVPVSFLDSIPAAVTAFEETDQTVGELDMSDMARCRCRSWALP